METISTGGILPYFAFPGLQVVDMFFKFFLSRLVVKVFEYPGVGMLKTGHEPCSLFKCAEGIVVFCKTNPGNFDEMVWMMCSEVVVCI